MRKGSWWRVPLFLLPCAFAAGTPLFGAPVDKYGQLQVVSGQLCDSKENPVQLKGMSTMGLQWYGGIVNEAAFAALAKDWNVDVIRLAMYVGEDGYATHPELKQLVTKGVNLAIAQGIYVIIDWHVLTPGNPNDRLYAGAADFFREMSATFGKTPNVIYEIMNEPNGRLSWKRDLKPYAQKIVSVIRANDPDNIILIGSGTWSQEVDVAASDPVPGKNLMYTVHFYSGTHGKDLRERVQAALSKGAAVFCSEWGTSEASGNGGPYINAAEEWLKFLDEKKISWVNWSLANKNETSAAFKALLQVYVEGKGNVVVQKETPLVPAVLGACGIRYWPQDQLSVSGAYVRAKIKDEPLPLYSVPIAAWDFESGLSGWGIADDSGAKPTVSVGTAETKALTFQGDWSGPAGSDTWASAPRLKIADTGLAIGPATAITFTMYLEAGKTVARQFEVTPVLQFPPAWWTQLPAVKFSYSSGEAAINGLLKYAASVPVKVAPDTKMAHLLFVVVGAGTGYKGLVAFDDIVIVATSNGDASIRSAAALADDPGIFKKLPWDFEDGSRQGWTVTADSPAQVKLTVAPAESKALTYSYGWKNPGPDDPWNAAPRISSSFIELPAADYTTLTFDVHFKAGAATTGLLQVQPVIQSPQHGYWFQMDPCNVDLSTGKAVSGGLLKYSFSVPLKSKGKPMKADAVITNLILITIGLETDYEGTVQYDNINLK